ncbi:hypothetical protein [Pseudoduganella umbonata]|uniref:Uncharacterized protein n=1 Tax=Pseudoduganella umbonata TaxID=864828 RepID=A0A7W5E7B5_9BURK|nr:hypothetical protein [Pseudoduganella umbonata]MBB3219376.1 hypothetical protein [Pseudoduganella umbonata]
MYFRMTRAGRVFAQSAGWIRLTLPFARWQCRARVAGATLLMAGVPAALAGVAAAGVAPSASAPAALVRAALVRAAWSTAASSNIAEATALPAFAMAPYPLPLPAAVSRLPVLPPPLQAASLSGSGAGALGDASLAELRGGTETPWSDMRLNGTVGGNSAVHVVTGSNSITDGAFSNASGLPMVIQNSGANVLIQNATIVNVQIR